MSSAKVVVILSRPYCVNFSNMDSSLDPYDLFTHIRYDCFTSNAMVSP